VDGAGNTFVTGTASSSAASFPETVGPDLTYNGSNDAFVAKISAGKDDYLGSWESGVYYRNSDTGAWFRLESSPATRVVAGDLDGDGYDDLIGTWAASPGVYVKYSSTGTWQRLDNYMPLSIGAADMNGDGRADLLGSWSGFGVYYRNSLNGDWIKLEASPASQVGAGDLDGDGKADLLGTWTSQPGAWVKYSQTGTWAKLDPVSPYSFSAGKMRAPLFSGAGFGNGSGQMIGLPRLGLNYEDLSEYGPGGSKFRYTIDKNPKVGSAIDSDKRRPRKPGPGEPGFRPVKLRPPAPAA